MADARSGFDRSIANFQLRYDDGSTFKCGASIGNHRRIDGVICRFCYCDQVLACDAVNKNKGDPARGIPNTLKIIDIDSLFQKPISSSFTESIRSISPEKRDFSPSPRCRHGLIGALATTEHLKLPSKNGFPRIRQTLAENDHIRVRTADYQDVRFDRHARFCK